MSLPGRLFALDNKLGLLRRETTAWRAECAGAASRFALHASQIGAVCDDLDAMHQRIGEEIGAARPALAHAQLQRQERRILAALQIWDSYRAKWALRVEPRLAETLNLIDDLAWQAYRPALEAAIQSGSLPPQRARLPPLVFPSPRWSPFARPREQGYEIDESSGALSLVEDFDDLLRCMPVPLIGIPWTQAAHLAEAVFVGHECGHLVEEDLALQEPLRLAVRAALDAGTGALDSAAEERAAAWSEHWRSEVFADLWGLLCCGPAYARMLAEVLADTGTQPEAAQPDRAGRFGAYPPRALRMKLLAEGLRRIGALAPAPFENAALDIEQRIALLPALPAPMQGYADDAAPVVEALLGTPLAVFAMPGQAARPVRAVLAFSATMQQKVQADASRALLRQPLTGDDVRVLFAGLAWAFLESPADFRDRDVQARFEARLSRFRTQGVRSGTALRQPLDTAQARQSVADAVFRRVDRPAAG